MNELIKKHNSLVDVLYKKEILIEELPENFHIKEENEIVGKHNQLVYFLLRHNIISEYTMNELLIKETAEQRFRCKCGHNENQSDIHGVADYTGKEFWGDMCDRCFSYSELEIDEERKMTTWKWKSKEAQEQFEKNIVEG